MNKADVIIIGSGVAALQLAVHLRNDLNVIVLTKSALKSSNSSIAQGGIAAALGKMDDPSLHFLDTIEAGRFHNDPSKVKKLVEEAPWSLKNYWIMDANLMFIKMARFALAGRVPTVITVSYTEAVTRQGNG
nr:FAD-binding protein [Halobacillus salinarum]